MSAVPRRLLAAILDVCGGDQVAAQRLAREWEAALARSEEIATRIRAEVLAAGCSCAVVAPVERLSDGRCARCYGRLDRGGR